MLAHLLGMAKPEASHRQKGFPTFSPTPELCPLFRHWCESFGQKAILHLPNVDGLLK